MSLVTFVAFSKDENAEHYVVDWQESTVRHFGYDNNLQIAKSLQYLNPSEPRNSAQNSNVLTSNCGQKRI